MGSCPVTQGAQWQPRGLGWGGGWAAGPRGRGHIYTLMADSQCCKAEANTTL